ncbi:hypothetical protein F53441_6485 [Fusarium austroafricanum]|uniref:Uncharacterized protein n=1 Tax=Fusarium austroafricanum TaxID=2364996 RepID=A0A8H4NZH1_9HYPO|nr:hypothetical protein F53441_6485 [Fusarium austroafricanum]
MRDAVKRLMKRLLRKPAKYREASVSTPTIAPEQPTTLYNYQGVSDNDVVLSPLESLPFDIRHQILLSIGSIADLSSLVHASPTFHQHYHLHREFWLVNSLELELGLGIVDACTVHLSNTSNFRQERTETSVRHFVSIYQSRRTDRLGANSMLDKSQILFVVTFHTTIVKPLAAQFVSWAHGNHHNLSSPTKLSGTENRRILRAFYRFQLFCNLFGYYSENRRSMFSDEERLEWFLDIYEPWEIEEILSVNTFVESKYQKVLEEVAWDLHEDNPRWDAGRTDPFTPTGAYHIDGFGDFYRVGMTSLGLSLLSSVFKAQDHAVLLDLVEQNIVSSYGDWFDRATDELRQDHRREHLYSDRDRAQERREKMPFKGDREDMPPLAWVALWKGTYSNLYGSHMPPNILEWGYVMWDYGRLSRSGAIATLDAEWKASYTRANGDPEDPRDWI